MLNIAIPLKSQPSRLSSLWMLFFIVLVAVPLAVIVNWRRGVVQEHAAARRLAELGGKINSLDGFYYKMGWLLPPNCDYQITGYASGYVGEQCPVTAEVLKLLVQLPNMHTLQLSGEKQAAFSAAPLRGLSQLKYLSLSCGVNNEDVLAFHNQRSLETLSLNNQPITDKCLSLAACNPGLKYLCLRDTSITSDGLAQLTELQKLQSLDLGGTGIDDRAIPHLVKLRGLTSLQTQRTQLTKAGRAQLKQMMPGCVVD